MSTGIFGGHAKPPANTVSGQMYTILSVVCDVDVAAGVIIAAEFSVATELAKDYLNRLLTGRNLGTDEDAIVAELERSYFSGTQKAPIQAFRDMTKRYRAQVGAGRPMRRRSRPRRPADRFLLPPAGRSRCAPARATPTTRSGRADARTRRP